MTEPMSREEARDAAVARAVRAIEVIAGAWDQGPIGVALALTDAAKSRPIDLGDGVMVARLEEFGTTVDRDEDDEPIESSEVALYLIRTDQPAAEEGA